MFLPNEQRQERDEFFRESTPERGLYGRRRVEFTVLGVVVPQGSAKSFGFQLKDAGGNVVIGRNGKPIIRTVTTADNPGLKEWRRLVADGARRALPEDFTLITGPVALTAVFYLPRPKSAKKSVVVPITRPDLDKVLRGVLDALTQVVYNDDNQVYRVLCEKRYAEPNAPASAHIALEG